MTFTTLPQMAQFLRRTHMIFAESPFQSDWLDILGKLNKAICETAVTGATFHAMTDCSHGEVETEVEISKTADGAWLLIERPIRKEVA